jgi:hypothetical protein
MVVTEGQATQIWVNAIVSQKFATLLERPGVDSHARLGQLRAGGASCSFGASANSSVRIIPERTSQMICILTCSLEFVVGIKPTTSETPLCMLMIFAKQSSRDSSSF